MQFSAAAKPCLFLLSVVTLLTAGCGALEQSGGDDAVLRSEALAFDPGLDPTDRSDNPAETSTDPVEPTDGDAEATDPPADGAEPAEAGTPAAGSTDPDPVLSPDPDVDYPADTCYLSSFLGQAAEAIDCAEPHDIEVYASVDLPGGPDAPYQGFDAAIAACGPEFRQRTGIGLNLATVFERSMLRPSEETWLDGERTVTCYVVYPELTSQRLASIDPVRSFGRVSVFGLAIGDCLVAFDRSASWFDLTTCDQPHEAEVFVADRQIDAAFPGDDVLDAAADQLCFGQPFEDFVGRDYATSSVFAVVSVPTAETWAQGDQTINCILTDDLIRSSSFRDSGL